MANDERDANHIWLRQSVRFSEGGRERTIEIALPLPLGATPPEVERLLAEADAGMARLSQHLERQLATALRDDMTAPAAAFAPATPAATPAAARDVPAPSAPVASIRAAAPLSPQGEGPGVRTPPRASHIAEPPVMPPAAPVAPARAAAPLAAPAEGSEVKTSLTRPEFLAETRALGLTPPQVMERLGVRTLDGLNLREALDMLRRQVGGSALPTPEQHAAPAAANGAAPASPRAAAPASPAVFDEEEEFELVVLGPDMQTEDYGAELPYGDDAALDSTVAPDALDALDEDGDDGALDDVPDLGDVLPPAPEPARLTAGSAFTPAQKARARELVAAFRAVTAGGSPARSQHTAFANVVADQLSAATAATLVRGLWGQPPERLGTDQLDAVIRWGKQDEFAEEAPVVLALLRAEQARQSGASTAAAAPPAPASDAPAPRATRAARKPASGGGQS